MPARPENAEIREKIFPVPLAATAGGIIFLIN
jgi:hypothetical protein